MNHQTGKQFKNEEKHSVKVRPSEVLEEEQTAASYPAASLDEQSQALKQLPLGQQQAAVGRIGRVQGNAHVQRLVASIQRDGNDFQLSTPSLSMPRSREPSLGAGELTLDPEIEAQIRALTTMRGYLGNEQIHQALLQIEPSVLGLPDPIFSAPTVPRPTPLVPAGAGPAEPRSASAGDLIRAIMGIPAVDGMITNLRAQAVGTVERDWRSLSTGGQVAVVGTSIVIGGGALAGVISDPAARSQALSLLNGRTIPVPAFDALHLEINTERDGLMLGLHFDVGRYLPSLGFGPSSPSPIGGPPSR